MQEAYDKLIDRLTVIRGLTELLMEGTFGPLTKDQHQVLDEVVMEADELHTILHRVASRFIAPGSTPRC